MPVFNGWTRKQDLCPGKFFLLQNRMTQGFVVDRVQAIYSNLDQAGSDHKSALAAVHVFGGLGGVHVYVIGLGS